MSGKSLWEWLRNNTAHGSIIIIYTNITIGDNISNSKVYSCFFLFFENLKLRIEIDRSLRNRLTKIKQISNLKQSFLSPTSEMIDFSIFDFLGLR